MLSDRTILRLIAKGELGISRIQLPSQFQPASVDLRLDELSTADGWVEDTFVVEPKEFLLGSTVEYLRMPSNLVGQVHGKSTRARQGLIVEAAGLVDPGFCGQLTLEIFNMSGTPIKLEKGMLICQISFDWMDTTPMHSYGQPELGSHYQGQQGPTPARL